MREASAAVAASLRAGCLHLQLRCLKRVSSEMSLQAIVYKTWYDTASVTRRQLIRANE